MRWLILSLAVLDAGYMVFDGTRALVVGDYLTPKSGEYAGQLGPWSHLAKAAGIEPRSTLMKCIFAGYGALWFVAIGGYAARARWGWRAMLFAAAFSLWNLVIGTIFGLVQIALLLMRRDGGSPAPPPSGTRA